MASVTSFTAARTQAIENAAIIDGEVVAGNLILTRFDSTTINAGSVIGPTGPTGTMPSVARVRAVFALDEFQSIANGTVSTVNFANEEFDSDSFHSTTTNTSRLTVPSGKAGVYIVTYTLYYAPAASGIAQAWIVKNGGATRYASSQSKTDSSQGCIVTSSEPIPLAENDYVQLQTFQNSGGALNCGQLISAFSMVRLGPL